MISFLFLFSLFFFSTLTLGLSHNGKQETGRDAKDKKEKDKGGKRGEEDLLEINGGSQQNGTGTSLSGWASLVSSGCPPQMGCFTGGVWYLQKYMRYRLEDGTRPDTLAGVSPKARPAERRTVS